MFSPDMIKSKIEKKLNGAIVRVWTPRDDNEHFAIHVTWQGFKNMKLIEQHRVVYGILNDEFKAGIHSISLKTTVQK